MDACSEQEKSALDLHVCSRKDARLLRLQVISCEMVEAVGHENLLCYFAAIARALRPGGLAVIQVGAALACSDLFRRCQTQRPSSLHAVKRRFLY